MITSRVSRIAVVAALLFTILVCSGCSFGIPIVLMNNTDDVITVNYSLKNKFRGRLIPELESSYSTGGTSPFPAGRLQIDFERGIVEAKLMPGETMLIDMPNDRLIEYPDEHFNLRTLRITSETGTLALEGEHVFEAFRPIEKSRFAYGPKYNRYVLKYSGDATS